MRNPLDAAAEAAEGGKLMGVYIKGMEMPETCYECPCGDNEFYECMATKGRISYHHDEFGYPDGERQEWCPLVLVPPHGRLIDADALLKGCKRVVGEFSTREYAFSQTAIENAPTIIPAEEET